MCPLDVSMHWTVTMSIQNYANEMTRYYMFISYHVIIRLSINREQLKLTKPTRLSNILDLIFCPDELIKSISVADTYLSDHRILTISTLIPMTPH